MTRSAPPPPRRCARHNTSQKATPKTTASACAHLQPARRGAPRNIDVISQGHVLAAEVGVRRLHAVRASHGEARADGISHAGAWAAAREGEAQVHGLGAEVGRDCAARSRRRATDAQRAWSAVARRHQLMHAAITHAHGMHALHSTHVLFPHTCLLAVLCVKSGQVSSSAAALPARKNAGAPPLHSLFTQALLAALGC